MRSALFAAAIAALLLPTAAMAANSPLAKTPARHASRLAGMTRDAYIHRAEQRAGRHFDRLDSNHDGVLQQSEIDAWHAAHPRHRHAMKKQPASK